MSDRKIKLTRLSLLSADEDTIPADDIAREIAERDAALEG